MGNLAERYGDRRRSGLYRVRSARIPTDAAHEAGVELIEWDLQESAWPAQVLQARLLNRPTHLTSVAIIHGADALLEMGERLQFLAQIADCAKFGHETKGACFVVLVDPYDEFQLPPLWKEPRPAADERDASRSLGF